MFFNRSTLFMDFRGEAVRVVQGRPMDDNLAFTVDGYGAVVLPGHLGYRNDDKNTVANAARLKEFLQKKGMKADRVVAGLGQSGVITRIVRVPKVPPATLDRMMKLNIGDHLPVSPEEYAFDYKVVDEVEEEGVQSLELMVAAVNRSQAEQCASLLEEAGLTPMIFDILPSMLQRLVVHLPFRDTLVVDGGKDGTRLAIFKGKTLFMYADIPFVPGSSEETDYSALAGELRGYLDYFSSRNFGKTVDGISILGDLAGLNGLAGMLGEYIQLPINIGLTRGGYLKFKGRAAGFKDLAAVYSGNLGLMMRGSKHQPSVEYAVYDSGAASSGASLGA